MRYRTVALIILGLFLICSAFIFVIQYGLDRNHNNTVEYTADVSEVIIWDTRTKVSVQIRVGNYDGVLLVAAPVADHFLQQIDSAETITFRIPCVNAQEFEETGWGTIVALEADGVNILSLEEYNQYTEEYWTPFRIVLYVFEAVLVSLWIFLTVKRIRTKRNIREAR